MEIYFLMDKNTPELNKFPIYKYKYIWSSIRMHTCRLGSTTYKLIFTSILSPSLSLSLSLYIYIYIYISVVLKLFYVMIYEEIYFTYSMQQLCNRSLFLSLSLYIYIYISSSQTFLCDDIWRNIFDLFNATTL